VLVKVTSAATKGRCEPDGGMSHEQQLPHATRCRPGNADAFVEVSNGSQWAWLDTTGRMIAVRTEADGRARRRALSACRGYQWPIRADWAKLFEAFERSRGDLQGRGIFPDKRMYNARPRRKGHKGCRGIRIRTAAAQSRRRTLYATTRTANICCFRREADGTLAIDANFAKYKKS